MLSAIIFLIVLDGVLRRSLDGRRRGILWRLTEHVKDLDCADDIVLLSHNFRDMQAKLDDLVEESQKVGLRVNIEKIGHTLRKNQNEICHSVLEWNPQGGRSRGRPKATWKRTVLAECRKTSFGEVRAQAKNRQTEDRWPMLHWIIPVISRNFLNHLNLFQ